MSVILPLMEGRELGWPWWSFALVAAGVVLLGLFARHQSNRDARGATTLLTPSLFRRSAFTGGLVVGLFFFGGFMGSGLVLAVLFQVGLGLTPLQSALATIPQAVGMIGGFVLSQRLGIQRRTMLVGMGLAAVGQLAIVALLATFGDTLEAWWPAPALLLMGVGVGTAMGPFFDLVLSGIADHEAGSASGALTATQQVGGAFGMAVLGTVLFSVAERSDLAHGALWAYLTAIVFAAAGAVCTRLLLPRAGTAHEQP